LFFFQAEDGIRDFHVTGVQTCALPIFLAITGTRNKRTLSHSWRSPSIKAIALALSKLAISLMSAPATKALSPSPRKTSTRTSGRSEERRVGKERRSAQKPDGAMEKRKR